MLKGQSEVRGATLGAPIERETAGRDDRTKRLVLG